MKVYTLICSLNSFDNTTRNMSLRKDMKLLDSKFEFAGEVVNWSKLGYELSVVSITTAVV